MVADSEFGKAEFVSISHEKDLAYFSRGNNFLPKKTYVLANCPVKNAFEAPTHCWVILEKKTGTPMAAFVDGDTKLLLAFTRLELAHSFLNIIGKDKKKFIFAHYLWSELVKNCSGRISCAALDNPGTGEPFTIIPLLRAL